MRPKSDHVKYNALKNTVYIPVGELMPCLRRCPFKELCHIYDSIYSDTGIKYAGHCPVECALYLDLHEYFSSIPTYASVDQALIEEYVSLYIMVERMKKQVSLHPDLITEGNKLSKPYEILSRLQKKFLKATEEIMTAVREMIEGGHMQDEQDSETDK